MTPLASFGSETTPKLPHLQKSIVSRLGVDSSVGFTILLRLWTSTSALLTLWLVATMLDLQEQGYFYTFGSLLALQVFAELGVNFVVMQFASHEMASLAYNAGGELHGDAIALRRLAGLLRFSVLWFAVLGTAFIGLVVPTGAWFLARDASAAAVSWKAAWICSAVLAAFLLFVGPFLSLIEGCGKVAASARARLLQAVFGSVVMWSSLALGAKLFALPLSFAASLVSGVGWLALHERPMLSGLLRVKQATEPRRLFGEILPMQWRIALSWLAGYFVAQLFTPVLFSTRGSGEAGQMGMSLSLASGVGSVALAWITTKSPVFGVLVARDLVDQLDQLFARVLRQALGVAIAVAFALGVLLVIATRQFPALGARLVSPVAMVALVLGSVASVILTAEAAYLRAFKREPFLFVSLLVGLSSVIATLALAPRYGANGVAIGYCVVNWGIGVGVGTLVFRRMRSAKLNRPV